jgi:hypothetical protein
LRFAIADCVVLAFVASLLGCAHSAAPSAMKPRGSSSPSPTTTPTASEPFPILYHRTGGIAGTDDRVVIWPDGVVQVEGRQLVPASTRFAGERFNRLRHLLDGWSSLKDQYLASDVADAYTITISYGGKSVVASDLAPDLPETFRLVFGEIETIAAEAATPPTPVPGDPGP